MDNMAPTRTQTPDSDTETPPLSPSMKRSHHGGGPHAPGVYYKECMKNHAASIGGHALDGCCEFMPAPTFNPTDPTSLKCAACGCHRNFHRRDPDDPAPLNHHLLLTAPPARKAHSPPSASKLLLSLSQSPSDEFNPTAVNPTPAGGGGGGTGGGGKVLGHGSGGQTGNFTSGSSSSSKKRFRTKFTQEQKEKMYEFSEKIGWKLKKGEEKLVEEFVKEIDVGRSVFKVWMHNNKHNSSKRERLLDQQQNVIQPNNLNHHNQTTSSLITSTTTSIFGLEEDEQIHEHEHHQKLQQQQQRSTSNGSNSGNNSNTNNNNSGNNASVGGVGGGNCGASVAVDHHHHLRHPHHHHHQFNFVSGTEAQAQ